MRERETDRETQREREREREREGQGVRGEREKEVPEGDSLWGFHIPWHCSTSTWHFDMINPGLTLRCEVRGCIVKGETLGDLVSCLYFPLPSLLSHHALTGI